MHAPWRQPEWSHDVSAAELRADTSCVHLVHGSWLLPPVLFSHLFHNFGSCKRLDSKDGIQHALYFLADRTILILAGGSAGPPEGFVTVPGNPRSVFQVSAVLLSLVPRAKI